MIFYVLNSAENDSECQKPKNPILSDFLLNVISTQVIPESDKNRIFRFLTFGIVFCAI